uniref:MALT paracaspase 1 n=1 Tax=Gouania willdenowi TaxID=441366 RepID=A0A8C5HSC1_GOUWI
EPAFPLMKNNMKLWRGSNDMEMCSLKVLELEGSPSHMLLRLMGERGCTTGHLIDYLKTLGNTEALQCLQPPALQIVIQPQSVALLCGYNLHLSCHAVGQSPLQYQWFKSKEEVPNGISPNLVISPVQLKDAGFYICRVNSGDAFEFSHWAEVDVLNISTLSGKKLCVSLVDFGENVLLECGAVGRPIPQYQWHKNAVPIPNGTKRKLVVRGELSKEPYKPLMASNHVQLKAPMVDVYDLTNLLRQLNFKVVSLLDLTESEMRNAVEEFLLLLHKGVYGLLYYAGHGYENYGNSFMVPVDAPNPYRSANCLCVQSILRLMQEKETGLNVFLLDMCRKRNFHCKSTPNIVLRVTANIVFGYATCQDAEAFELSSTGFINGVFVKFLKKRLLDDEKITVMLDRVAEDMGHFDATKGKQALEIRSSLSERRALTDVILPGDSEDQTHSRQWAKAHELPESMCLDFDCGAQIKLGFAAEFSNVLIIYTHIVKKPTDMSFCQAHVTDFSKELDVDPKEINRETPEETGIYLLSSSLPQHCLYTRISSLQKLRGELVFTVCLQGSFTDMDDDHPVHWTKTVNIGKPLIARLALHRAMRRNSCLQTCPIPHSPSCSPCHSPTPEHHLHQGGYHNPDYQSDFSHNNYLDVFEPMQGAVGGRGESYYDNLNLCHHEPDDCGPSNPIEASDDIDELQTAFINSLQLQSQ